MSGKKNNVVARLTITRANNWKTIIEVHSDATFSKFYTYYRQFGNRRSTKEFIHTRSRNEGLRYINAHLQTPGLEVLADRAADKVYYGRFKHNAVTSMKLRIIKKREYRRLLHAAPIGMPVVKPIFQVRNPTVGIPLLLPTRRVREEVGG